MSNTQIWAGLLCQWLMHEETGCPHSARHALRLMDALCSDADLDGEVRALIERAGQRLEGRLMQEVIALQAANVPLHS